ncbi:RING-type domain-containing protein [Trichostrongylus colubriformis]|uniref:RING-type domain-containing protein n=1 Tax=Trichostrongylus colubriformis TaxID=6319 RepID=A0AAN8IN08_TRICO
MWSATEALAGIVPNCICGASYDLRFCAPHTLPCAHTFCLMCLSKQKQTKKQRCPCCRKKYSSFVLNLALVDVIERVRRRREWLEERSLRCDECESRRSATSMRRCLSCIRHMSKHISTGLTLDCVICLECCVGRHNGHELTPVASSSCSSCPPDPVASSTPRDSYSHRKSPWGRNKEYQRAQTRGTHSHQLLLSKPDLIHPRVPATSSRVEEELVYEVRSPLYYRMQKAASEDVSISNIAKRLSGLLLNVSCAGSSSSNKEESAYHKELDNSSDSGVTSSANSAVDRKDISIYQSISPYAACNIAKKAFSTMLPLDWPG